LPDEICRHLTWDSEFFGSAIATLLPHRLTPEILGDAEAWCLARGIDCLYFLADSDDRATVRMAEDHHFRFVDVRLTVARPVGPAEAGPSGADARPVRRLQPEDIPALRSLARVSHRDSRFYADPGFPEPLCDALYETWVEKSCHGYADAVFVADMDGVPSGYVTLHRDKDGEGRLGLIAVDPKAQGRGLGSALLAEAVDWCRREGLRSLGAVTQGRNLRAQRMYARSGFIPQAFQLWYHRWFPYPTRSDQR
jgi:dTDP-4-amino-4,6-dideoxy-D-galactose acyltransferase